MTRSKTFPGTPDGAALVNPFIAPPHAIRSGIPLGVDLRSKDVLWFDPWRLKNEGFIKSTTFGVLGDVSRGKSTLMKSLAIRLSMLQAGLRDDGTPRQMRVRINDRRPEDGKPEYGKVTEFLQSKVVKLSEMQVNLLDPRMRMTKYDILETVTNLVEQMKGGPLVGFMPLALQVAVNKMPQEQASMQQLEHIILGLSLDDVQAYYRSNGLHEELRQPDQPEYMQQYAAVADDQVRRNDFERDAALVAQYIGWITRGPYGSMFGGQQSLRELLSQPVVTLDWTDVNDNAQILLEAMLWKWQATALYRNDLDLIPHVSIGDEIHEAMRNPMYVRFRSAVIKKARAFPTADFTATQYHRDIARAGSEGSEIRSLAEGILLGIGGWLVGPQPNNPEVFAELTENLGMSTFDARQLTRMLDERVKGCFALVLPGRSPVFFQHILTPTELALVGSDSASEKMMNRVSVADQMAHWS